MNKMVIVGSIFIICLCIWLLNKSSPLQTWQLSGVSNAIAFSSNSELLATSSGPIEERKVEPYYGMYRANSSVELRNLKDGSIVRTFKVFYATSIAFSPDNSLIAVGNFLGEIFIWRVEDGELIYSLNPPTKRQISKSIGKLIFSSDGKTLVSVIGTTVDVWNVLDGQVRYRISNEFASTTSISTDSKLLATLSNPITIYRLNDGAIIRQLKVSGIAKFSQDW
ncbi:MAG: WD40 repeat domain-containing protein, partial [Xenococcaceae cyanobacterium]